MKFYTAFIFADTNVTGLHVTHKFLGPLNDEQLLYVQNKIDQYFISHDVAKELPARVSFTVEDWFGPTGKIRVLLPPVIDPEHWLMGLRYILSKVAPDNYPGYRPHISVPDPLVTAIDAPFSHYALMVKDTIMLKWPIR